MPVLDEMAVVRIPYVKAYTDRHGRVRRYFRKPGCGCGQLLMYRYFRNSILIDFLPELFPPGFRERERTQA